MWKYKKKESMKNLNLTQVSLKLHDLAQQMEEVFPKAMEAEATYERKKAELMLASQGLASQPLRDASVTKSLSETKEYKDYLEVVGKKQVINQLIRIYTQISKSMISASWGEVDYGSE